MPIPSRCPALAPSLSPLSHAPNVPGGRARRRAPLAVGIAAAAAAAAEASTALPFGALVPPVARTRSASSAAAAAAAVAITAAASSAALCIAALIWRAAIVRWMLASRKTAKTSALALPCQRQRAAPSITAARSRPLATCNQCPNAGESSKRRREGSGRYRACTTRSRHARSVRRWYSAAIGADGSGGAHRAAAPTGRAADGLAGLGFGVVHGVLSGVTFGVGLAVGARAGLGRALDTLELVVEPPQACAVGRLPPNEDDAHPAMSGRCLAGGVSSARSLAIF